ncbi:MAG: DUF983 domain-containing protein [Phenylobacterium sp.]|nr:DUF983 domain-containing protein [Phenylobacterium sp.]MDO8913455.1 DUF983 domain-containing protein [Phenylobacterium sp.]MDO9249863.1 DUF983 domain-containing protein [Phenylobacterium sp.]MDP3101826.1 DUF983 domain-containing protein [Phenylobacterium sp.]MDP3867727.1 DUF983 domain-containing protein [Phenylobacterium sp.]HQT55754.1 DUF983 domain-containing protein [Phenylobacterium sp.]
MAVMSRHERPTLVQAMIRGLRGRCPHCERGRLYWKYLKVEPRCQVCGHDIAQYPADDGPAYFTILIVGHLLVAPLLLFPIIWQAPAAIMLPATLIPLAAATLALLPRVKGAFIGLLYALKVKEQDAHLHTADIVD